MKGNEDQVEMSKVDHGKHGSYIIDGLDVPSAPLLDVNAGVNVALGWTLTNPGIKITKEATEREYGPFAFYVKDAIHEKLLLNGEVNFKQCATMTGDTENGATNSKPTIEVKRIVTPSSSDLKFDITQGDISLGVVSIEKYDKVSLHLNAASSSTNYSCDFCEVDGSRKIQISKNTETLAKIIYPKPKGYEPFEIFLEFPFTETGPISDTEKHLFISVAVAYMMFWNGDLLTQAEHNFWAGLGYVIGIGILIAIIVGLYFLFSYLTANCNRPGYTCRSRKY